MKSRHALMALAALVLVVGMAAPVAAQDNTTVDDGDDVEEPEEDDNETEDDDGDDLNETEDGEEENETEDGEQGPPGDVPRGESAQFDARLMTAINTVDALTEIAPNDDVEQRLEEALSILRGVQEDTDTASLGPDNKTGEHEDHNHTHEEENRTEADGESEQRGPPGDRGPSGNQGGGPPGFVRNMLSGIFG